MSRGLPRDLMCVIMLDMIKASIRELQHHLSKVMRHVEHGEEVFITRRNRVVAKIVPAVVQAETVEWPDFVTRATTIVGPQKGIPPSQFVVDDREERV